MPHSSGPERSPSRHDPDQAVSLKRLQSPCHAAARNAVMLGEPGHGRQRLAAGPFGRLDTAPKISFYAL